MMVRDFGEILAKNGIDVPVQESGESRALYTQRSIGFWKRWSDTWEAYQEMVRHVDEVSADAKVRWKVMDRSACYLFGEHLPEITIPVIGKFSTPAEAEVEIRNARSSCKYTAELFSECKGNFIKRWFKEEVLSKMPNSCYMILIKDRYFKPSSQKVADFNSHVERGENSYICMYGEYYKRWIAIVPGTEGEQDFSTWEIIPENVKVEYMT